MKYKVITSFIGLLLFFLANSQQPVLTARHVAERFLAAYDISQLSYPIVEFEKRGEDWFVKTINVSPGNEPSRSVPIMFYDGRKQKFVQLPFEKNTRLDPKEYIDDLMPEYEAYNFDIQPYYGYAGWYKDVIKEYGRLPDPSDAQLYSLARAYSSQAIEPVTGQGGFVVPSDIYKLSLRPDAFSDKQLAQFNASADSAIEKYRKLSVRNPSFPTRVGDSRDKYANEIMFKYHILLTFSEKGLKQMKLPPGIYKDSILQAARDYLNACPQQSIFVSLGDADFYPLFYVQQTEGLRKDVHIINYNLMALDKFIYRATLPQGEARGIKISSDSTMYAAGVNDLIYVMDSTDERDITAAALLSFIRSGKVDDMGRKIIGIKSVELPFKRLGKFDTKVNVSMAGNYYLYKQHWILIDIINNLNGRVLCFPFQLSDELRGLNTVLSFKQEGPIFCK